MSEWFSCPKCGSEDINWGVLDVDASVIWRNNQCSNCDFDWREVFEFHHNETLDVCQELDDDGNVIEIITLNPANPTSGSALDI